MLWIGLVVNALAIVLGIGAGHLFRLEIPKKAQVSLLSFLAALLIFSALRNGLYLFSQFEMVSLLKAFFVSWACLVISSVGFRKSPLHRIFSTFTKSAQDSVANPNLNSNNWMKASLIGTAFYALSPLNFIACALAGIYSQTSEIWILVPFVVKALFDFIASLSLSNSLRISSLAITIPTATRISPVTMTGMVPMRCAIVAASGAEMARATAKGMVAMPNSSGEYPRTPWKYWVIRKT